MEQYENHLLSCNTDEYPLSGYVITRDGECGEDDEEYIEEMNAEILNDILKEGY